MRKFIFLLFFIAGLTFMGLFVYNEFFTPPELLSFERKINSEDIFNRDELKSFQEISFFIKLDREIPELDSFVIKNQTTNQKIKSIYSKLISKERNKIKYEVIIPNNAYGELEFSAIGYNINNKFIDFEKPLSVSFSLKHPIKLEELIVRDYFKEEEKISFQVALFNPDRLSVKGFKFLINDEEKLFENFDELYTSNIVKYNINIENIFSKDFEIILKEIIFEDFHGNILSVDESKTNYKVINIKDKYTLTKIDIPKEIYSEIEYYEFSISVHEDQSASNLDSVKIKINNDELILKKTKSILKDGIHQYTFAFKTPKVQEIEIVIEELLYKDFVYKINSEVYKTKVVNAFDITNIKTKNDIIFIGQKEEMEIELNKKAQGLVFNSIVYTFNNQEYTTNEISSLYNGISFKLPEAIVDENSIEIRQLYYTLKGEIYSLNLGEILTFNAVSDDVYIVNAYANKETTQGEITTFEFEEDMLISIKIHNPYKVNILKAFINISDGQKKYLVETSEFASNIQEEDYTIIDVIINDKIELPDSTKVYNITEVKVEFFSYLKKETVKTLDNQFGILALMRSYNIENFLIKDGEKVDITIPIEADEEYSFTMIYDVERTYKPNPISLRLNIIINEDVVKTIDVISFSFKTFPNFYTIEIPFIINSWPINNNKNIIIELESIILDVGEKQIVYKLISNNKINITIK